MKDDLANEDLAHLRAATEPKDDMLKRETPLPKASPVCPVCGLDRPHGHGQAELVSIIRESKNYATTLAVSMHRQHYAEAAPNWQPLSDLVGLLTQIDNMYAGLRNDLEAALVENKRLVGANLATLRADLAAAQAERDALFRSKSTLNTRVLAAEAEVQALRVAHEAALKEAVATEREEILKMLDRHKANWQKSWHGQGEVYTVLAVDTIAKAIKARGAAHE